MTIDEAIRILSDSANRGMTTFGPDFRDAERLGIEALKRILAQRVGLPTSRWFTLPGETEGEA